MANKKIKIAFLSRYQNKVSRGVETYVAELSKRLSKNHEVEVLFSDNADSFNKMISNNYDLVIPTNGRLQALKASIGRFKGRYKTIISGQAGPGRDEIWNIGVTAPDVYVALTDYELNFANKWAWKTKVIKIPNGVDLKRFKKEGKKINFGFKSKVILSIGAFEWYKFHERTIKAISKIEEVSLVLVGGGSQESELQELGYKLLGADRFKIVKANFSEIDQYYRSVDLFVLPSWEREAFGIVYLEALASGLAVVAPNDLTRREIVGNGGILTNCADIDSYSKAILDALEKDWQDLPRKQVEKFSWEVVSGKYEKLFEEIF